MTAVNQPEVTESQLQSLAVPFIRNNAQGVFSLHLMCEHFRIDEDMIMLGVGLGKKPLGFWTKPMKSASVDRNSIMITSV